MVTKRQNIVQLPSGLLDLKMEERVSKMIPAQTTYTAVCLNRAGIRIIRHPPYSPDLAPSDFWLFDLIKKYLDDHNDVESQKNHITKLLQSIAKELYKKHSISG